MSDKMQGRRVTPEGEHFLGVPGDYWKENGTWFAVTPNGMAATLVKHDVIEHDDGTITVSPSILVYDHADRWHGFLEHGVWREV